MNGLLNIGVFLHEKEYSLINVKVIITHILQISISAGYARNKLGHIALILTISARQMILSRAKLSTKSSGTPHPIAEFSPARFFPQSDRESFPIHCGGGIGVIPNLHHAVDLALLVDVHPVHIVTESSRGDEEEGLGPLLVKGGCAQLRCTGWSN